MKRLIPIIIISLFLSGCAAFAQFRNPIGITELAQIESSYGVLLAAGVGYRNACNKKVIPRTQCAPVVAKLQAADRVVQAALGETSKFVRAHPTVSAIDLISGVKSAIAVYQKIATENGVK